MPDPLSLPDEYIRAEYENGRSAYSLGKELGVDARTVQRRLGWMGLQVRGPKVKAPQAPRGATPPKLVKSTTPRPPPARIIKNEINLAFALRDRERSIAADFRER